MEGIEINLKAIEKKWQKKWHDSKLFEPAIDKNKPKFFCTFPYPYMNGYSHLGHLYTITKLDVIARYKRLRGFNVLFPQAWHCTGSPIVSAAQRIKEHEPKQIKIMHDMGFSAKDIKNFEEPEYWVEFFPKEFKKDYSDAGLSIDFTREFITTSLNPHYDKFIRWQFNKLKEKNYVVKGKHPVVWCPKEQSSVSDHARVEGEGETPQEFTLLKFKFDNSYLVAATLRPETVFGQTNLWIGPDIDYVKAKVNDETWIISKECASKLEEQDKEISIIEKVHGSSLLGKKASAPGINREIIILPSSFCDPKKGTGIVTSVPSDAPDDWMGLYDLQKDDKLAKKYNLNYSEIKQIKPIPIINSDELGDLPAVKVCQEMGIKSSLDRENLEKAKKLVYKKGFYAGIMNDNCGIYSNVPVERAKDLVKEDMIKKGQASVFYELTGKVICRCLTPAIIKIVSDQWFINYSNLDWKASAHLAVSKMAFYPDKARQQFDYVIDWLNDWACTREFGLGTKLPWDEKWVIESLSDSTIYMAYYTVSNLIKNVPIEKVDDNFFDYLFLDKGHKPDVENIDEMKASFNYWYPVDLRISGKDLIQNHLTFYIFNHTAIFPEKFWPKSISVNGHITIDSQKMGKSAGNFILMRDVVSKSADLTRAAATFAGEGLDDANWDTEFFETFLLKLQQFYDFVSGSSKLKTTNSRRNIDSWLESRLNQIIKDSVHEMELTNFRTAFQLIFFGMQRELKWYMKRTNNLPNKELFNRLIKSQLIILSPFIPHLCEELWEMLGNKGFISAAQWPSFDESKINPEYSYNEKLVSSILEDVRAIKELLKLEKIAEVELIVSESWKYEFYDMLKEQTRKTRITADILKAIMQTELRKYGGEITRLIPKLIGKLPETVLTQSKEFEFLLESADFFKSEFNAKVKITKAEDSREAKAKQALPGKPAIILR